MSTKDTSAAAKTAATGKAAKPVTVTETAAAGPIADKVHAVVQRRLKDQQK